MLGPMVRPMFFLFRLIVPPLTTVYFINGDPTKLQHPTRQHTDTTIYRLIKLGIIVHRQNQCMMTQFISSMRSLRNRNTRRLYPIQREAISQQTKTQTILQSLTNDVMSSQLISTKLYVCDPLQVTYLLQFELIQSVGKINTINCSEFLSFYCHRGNCASISMDNMTKYSHFADFFRNIIG